MNEIIQQQLEKEGYKIKDNGTYDVAFPIFQQIQYAKGEETNVFLFPIEFVAKKIKKIIKLPFRLGQVVWESLK